MSVRLPSTSKNHWGPTGGRSEAKYAGRPRAPVDPAARAEVLALLGDAPRTRDLLIEHLHKIQDRSRSAWRRRISWRWPAEMKLAMAEVYEVATFYHHFDVVEGETTPPAITVRVCDSIACDLAGSSELLAKLPALLGPGIRRAARAVRRPLRDRAVAVVGQNPIPHATVRR